MFFLFLVLASVKLCLFSKCQAFYMFGTVEMYRSGNANLEWGGYIPDF